jgi:hypothetical protein
MHKNYQKLKTKDFPYPQFFTTCQMCKLDFEYLAVSYAETFPSSGNTLELPFSGCSHANVKIWTRTVQWADSN